MVLDTNVYLHYKDFEQVDWKSMVGDDVTLCVPMIVLGEIDKHKDQGRGKIQKRAKKLSSRFSELFLQGETAKIAVEEMDNPPSTAFDDTRFHKDINDDWVILSALHASHDTSSTVIVSGDNGILLKAKHFGLGFYKMPDDLLLSVELSEEEKEIKKLREQLSRHENRQPSPVIEFKNRTDRLLINKPVFIDVKQELDTYEAQLRASHPYQSARQDRVDGSTHVVLKSLSLDYRPMDPWEKYNKELDEYFEKKLETLDLSGYSLIGISVTDLSQVIPGLTLARLLKQRTKAKISLPASKLYSRLYSQPSVPGWQPGSQLRRMEQKSIQYPLFDRLGTVSQQNPGG